MSNYATDDLPASTTVTTYWIVCGRCGREVRKQFFERDQWVPPKGWFRLSVDGDWRCGCILQRAQERDR